MPAVEDFRSDNRIFGDLIMTEREAPHRPDAPVTHRTSTRPGQPGSDKRRTDPNPHRPPAQPPYPPYEDDPSTEATSVHRDRHNS